MFGALVKTYYAEKFKIDPKNIFSVSVMPCISKKTEATRPEMGRDGMQDIDIVLTTRELGDMIKQARLNFLSLEDGEPDSILGDYSGAAVIFGNTGGVMEAALRTVADILTGENLKAIEYKDVKAWKGQETSVTLPVGGVPTEIKVAVAHGTANAAKVLDAIRAGRGFPLHRVMSGCVHGGRPVHVFAKARLDINPKECRANALYSEDENRSSENLMKPQSQGALRRVP